jgi:N4-gp56 family major capsid protein
MAGFSGTQYGDISPRVGIYKVGQMLAYADSQLVLEKFAKVEALPKGTGNTIKWRRPVPFPVTATALVEGVSPPPQVLEFEDVTATIAQYGAWVGLTDVIQDLHEDPVLSTMTELCGKQAADVKENIIWGVLRGGTQVIYTGTATTRATVNSVATLEDFRLAVRELRNNHAKPITKMLKASPNVATEPVNASFVAFAHTTMERDFREMDSFLPCHQYSSGGPIHPNEIGRIEEVRIILTPHLTPFYGAGNTTTTGVVNNGTAVDVYPIVIIAEDAYAVTPLRGTNAATINVKNPGEISYTDPLGQRGLVSWKMWFVATRLNELWMIRIESAASAL